MKTLRGRALSTLVCLGRLAFLVPCAACSLDALGPVADEAPAPAAVDRLALTAADAGAAEDEDPFPSPTTNAVDERIYFGLGADDSINDARTVAVRVFAAKAGATVRLTGAGTVDDADGGQASVPVDLRVFQWAQADYPVSADASTAASWRPVARAAEVTAASVTFVAAATTTYAAWYRTTAHPSRIHVELGCSGTSPCEVAPQPSESCDTGAHYGACDLGLLCRRAVGTCGTTAPGVCAAVPQTCTYIYKPVCGCDARTYYNTCWAGAYGMNIAHLGACDPPVNPCEIDPSHCRVSG